MINRTVILSAFILIILALIIRCHGYRPVNEGFRDYFAVTYANNYDPNPALSLYPYKPRKKKICENINGNIYWGCSGIRTDDYYLRKSRGFISN